VQPAIEVVVLFPDQQNSNNQGEEIRECPCRVAGPGPQRQRKHCGRQYQCLQHFDN
jgi:hypothetical protein